MTISPGWYQDPAEPTTQRYWDGAGWIGAPLPSEATPPAGPPAPVISLPPSTERQASPPAAKAVSMNGPPVRPHGLMLAAPSTRFWARMIDIGILLLLNALVNGWFIYKYVELIIPYLRNALNAVYSSNSEVAVPPSEISSLTLIITLLAIGLWFAYEVPATAQSGQTLGKRLLHIKIVRAESLDPIGFLRAWRRWNPMGIWLLSLTCCFPVPLFLIPQIIDVMFVAIDRSQRMALHDRSAATLVVRLPGAAGEKGK